jgi:hypothetical protein
MNEERRDNFDQVFKSWAERLPETPPNQAAAQVVGQLTEQGGNTLFVGSRMRFAAAAATLMLAVVVGWMTLRPEPPAAVPATTEVALPPLEENVILLWLDEQTPLYLTVAPPATKGGSS